MKKIIITIIAIIILVNICVYNVLSSLTYIKKYPYYYYYNYHQYYYFPLISVFSITFACDHVKTFIKPRKKNGRFHIKAIVIRVVYATYYFPMVTNFYLLLSQ